MQSYHQVDVKIEYFKNILISLYLKIIFEYKLQVSVVFFFSFSYVEKKICKTSEVEWIS